MNNVPRIPLSPPSCFFEGEIAKLKKIIQQTCNKNSKNKYLFLNSKSGQYQLVFRIPQRFGGGMVRQSLFTNDVVLARSIRDKYIMPILAEKDATKALEAMVKAIISSRKSAMSHIKQLDNIISGADGITLAEAEQRFEKWLVKSSGLRSGTLSRYRTIIRNSVEYIGRDKCPELLTKEDAIQLRDKLNTKKLGATTINNYFITFRSFLRWLSTEGIIQPGTAIDNFLIDLPTVRKKNTTIIPPSKADECMNCVPGWTLAPRIARYTGMRIGEIIACSCNYKGCSITTSEGIKCFSVSPEFDKTHQGRLIPICDKLLPLINKKELKNITNKPITDATTEVSEQKKYNRRVKAVVNNVSFHSWRVYANTMMMEAGIDEMLCKRILGHKNSNDVHYGYTAGRLEAMKKALEQIP